MSFSETIASANQNQIYNFPYKDLYMNHQFKFINVSKIQTTLVAVKNIIGSARNRWKFHGRVIGRSCRPILDHGRACRDNSGAAPVPRRSA